MKSLTVPKTLPLEYPPRVHARQARSLALSHVASPPLASQYGVNLKYQRHTANNLNQYNSRSVPGYVEVLGTANSQATVTVNGTPTHRRGDYFRAEVAVDNSSGPVWQAITNLAVLNNGTSPDIATNVVGNTLVAAGQETFTHDSDGNLTADSRWSYSWNAGNRLVSMESAAGVPSAAKRRLEFSYDPQGRRIQKVVYTNNGTIYLPALTNRFVYDGWNLVAVMGADNTLLRSLAWGTDLSGTFHGAGGVGGLLWIHDLSTLNNQPSTHFVAHDGNGNVSLLVNAADGTDSARYEYGPFGEVIRATGPMDKANPIRFSTQYTDDETDLVCYLHRYYNPSTGRWLSKDPIDEAGGLNLYGFVGNNGINSFDPFGLLDTPSSTITPWELGWEWLTGDDPKHREFKVGGRFAELLRKHEHIRKLIKKAADEAARRCANGCNNKDFQITGEQGKYDLGGVQGVGKYLKDYSTLLTGGLTGNLAVTFLGSYDATLTATGISCCAGKAHVKLDINNSSTAASALRPPVLGYTEWWQKNVAPLINRLFQNGGGSPTTQHIELNEDVTFKKSNCPN
ncbi:MAG: RHS repeat-associated core domain-containing protein [Verrucomicrobiota bacterium]